jgi:hypothetical protein
MLLADKVAIVVGGGDAPMASARAEFITGIA